MRIRGEYEYDLYLKNDYGTNGYTQWYYFKVQNTRKDVVYRFNIVNLMKPDSTYTHGMKPLIYSVKDAEKNGIGWQRDGFNIGYYQNSRKRKQTMPEKTSGAGSSASTAASGSSTGTGGFYGCYYSLTFELKFKCKYIS